MAEEKEDSESPKAFAIGINQVTAPDGKTQFMIQARNSGMLEEVYLFLLEHWLRTAKRNYARKFGNS